MRASKASDNRTPDIEIYRSFRRLDGEGRRRLAMRILHDQKMLADLYDHFLIQRSLDEPGQNLTWESFLRDNGSGH
jgi:hypothetical protein